MFDSKVSEMRKAVPTIKARRVFYSIVEMKILKNI